jgi:hypothetical protein
VSGYDIIGDIHGCASQLEVLLDALEYQLDARTGAYRHPDRQAIFVGDLIDRGEKQLRVLELVRAMVDQGNAKIVMGNHEFNAIAYDTEYPAGSGNYLRPRTAKNVNQHEVFRRKVTGAVRADYLEWFQSLPLWLDLGGLRVVHACWHEPSMRVVEDALGSNRFTSRDQFVQATTEGHPLYEAIEVLLKGPEVDLRGHGLSPCVDKDGHARHSARVAWWKADASTLRDLAVMDGNFKTEDGQSYPEIPDDEVDPAVRSFCYRDDVPLFYGHYWRTYPPKDGFDFTAHTACLDFSAVKDGSLVAYRWDHETEIRPDHYFKVR